MSILSRIQCFITFRTLQGCSRSRSC